MSVSVDKLHKCMTITNNYRDTEINLLNKKIERIEQDYENYVRSAGKTFECLLNKINSLENELKKQNPRYQTPDFDFR